MTSVEEVERRIVEVLERRLPGGEVFLRRQCNARRDDDTSPYAHDGGRCLLSVLDERTKSDRKSSMVSHAAEILSLSLSEAEALEAGFEGWDDLPVWEKRRLSPDRWRELYDLGERLGGRHSRPRGGAR